MVSVTITDITTLIIAITGLITAMSGTISVISRIRQRRRHGHDRRRVSRTISRMVRYSWRTIYVSSGRVPEASN